MTLGAHMHPYSYMYYTPHRDGVLQNIQHVIPCSSHTQPLAFQIQTDSKNRSSGTQKETIPQLSVAQLNFQPIFLAEHFILLNSRLNELSVESKNVQIGVRKGKLWSFEVDAADSQGCAEIWAHPRLPFCSGFCYPGTQCSVLDSPETS